MRCLPDFKNEKAIFMNLKCPISGTACSENTIKCEVCGFEDILGIARIIASREEAEYRLENVIKPYRREWELRKPKTNQIMEPFIQNPSSDEHSEGKIIKFGNYEWYVLKVFGEFALLITVDVIIMRAFNESGKDAEWMECDLRKYLNTEFLSTFNSDEQARIFPARTDDKFSEIEANAKNRIGKSIAHKVFLLSVYEARDYFGSDNDDDRIALYDDKAVEWWTRTSYKHGVCCIDNEGHYNESSSTNVSNNIGVRPAIFISINGSSSSSDERNRYDRIPVLATIREQVTPYKKCISLSNDHTVGLISNGTVVAVGNNENCMCDVSLWQYMIAVYASYNHTIGLRSDGGAFAIGGSENTYKTHITGNTTFDTFETHNWCNITDVVTSSMFAVGLRADGSIVTTGYDSKYKSKISNWKNIASIATTSNAIFGLKSD